MVHVSETGDQWRAAVNTVMIRVLQKAGNFLTS
jgi:hypothetical protein